ncbi:LADA_0A06568g1_1 [Lachancea dasiensis]|uniref:LADA_0A06568g1_1 n=1 Tax=Lachancea dasiensis TaxID=1072105 RepID=A0A1G4IPG6_9SACH|nr:LADA_0A06568g1_1 [Lachancea dasiensis]
MSTVAIVGSGVIGLSTAYELLSSPNLKVKQLHIIAQHFPGESPISHEYTSAWAGAHFRPFPHRPETFESDARESKYTRLTYKRMREIAAHFPESTIEFMSGIDYLENPTLEYDGQSPGFNATSLEEFVELPESALPQAVQAGFQYKTYCLNAPEYLEFLQNQVCRLSRARNVSLELKRMTLQSLSQVFEICNNCSVVFNCSGRGLQFDGSYDVKSFGIRGQTLLLQVPHDTKYKKLTVTHQDKNGNWTFVIKRPGLHGKQARYILGGTKQVNYNNVTPSEMDTTAIIERGRVLFPELMVQNKFLVERINVGFRPARVGGSRVELEKTSRGPIIHAYGLGGMGFETSFGVADHSLKLYGQTLGLAKL